MKISRLDFVRTLASLAAGALTLSWSRSALAGEGCRQCGCPEARRVCRQVCEEKKVPVTLWGMSEEDFCIPGPSSPQCENCEMVSDPKENAKTPSYQPKKFSWTQWTPCGSPTMFTKKKLLKKTVMKTVPTYKWVVEDLCADCEKAATTKEGVTK